MTENAPKPRVLIIDDDPTLRRLVQVVFEREGFDASLAKDGSEGVHMALMNPPNIIILDILMDGLHGFEVCKMLRASFKYEAYCYYHNIGEVVQTGHRQGDGAWC